jgi:hypothetical protein
MLTPTGPDRLHEVKYDAYRAVNSGNVAGLLNAAGGFVGGAIGSAIEDAATDFLRWPSFGIGCRSCRRGCHHS